MGWQEGRGLGQRGQGIVDPIEVRICERSVYKIWCHFEHAMHLLFF